MSRHQRMMFRTTQRSRGGAASSRFFHFVACLVVLGALLVFLGCGDGKPQIDFGTLEASAPHAFPPENRGDEPLRLAIASVFSAPLTSTIYRDFANYLGEKLDRPVELVLGKSYAETNALLRIGEVTLALVCPKPYTEANQSFGLELLAAPVVNGGFDYFSVLIVPRDSDVRSLADLAAKSFAFSDPLSNSGRLVPMYQLELLGRSPESFFGNTIFTYSHDNSVRAVASGVVEGAAVNSLVLDYLQETDPELTRKVRVVERWGPYGVNPFVVGPMIEPGLRARILAVLLEMDSDPEGVSILSGLRVERWAVPEDSIYDSVREMTAQFSRRGQKP